MGIYPGYYSGTSSYTTTTTYPTNEEHAKQNVLDELERRISNARARLERLQKKEEALKRSTTLIIDKGHLGMIW